MDDRSLLPNEIAEALTQGATVLTGNQRAARTLQHQFDLRNRALGLTSWEPPAILAWDAWTASLWQRLLLDGHTSRLLINSSQEHTIWRSILAADNTETLTDNTDTLEKSTRWSSLRSPDSLAEMAAGAWSRLCAYRGEDRLRSLGVSADTRAFQRWASAFARYCHVEGYLSPAQLEAALMEAVVARHTPLAPGGYALTGFDAITPAQASLVDAIRSIGTTVTALQLTAPINSRTLAVADNEHEELISAARWARMRLDQYPEARIALIVPGLDAQRAEIDRVLRSTLDPESEDMTASPSSPAFEFSLGVLLVSTPLVATALDLLRWPVQPLPLERVSQLLLSRFFAEGEERLARAEFDAYELRRVRTLRPEITLDGMLRAIEAAKRRQRLPRLLASVTAMRRIVRTEELVSLHEHRPYADWAEAMRALLEAAGWAAVPEEDSVEFQSRRKWESLLDELATLDFEGIRVPYFEALATVGHLAQRTLFAPQSRGAPVQIMGPLESAGSVWQRDYDAIWFLRAGDLAWPVRPGTSPLLSWQIQRELRMPGIDPAQDGDYARALTKRIARSAATVIFSYARESAAGRQRPSTALAGLDLDSVGGSIDIRRLVPDPPARERVALETIEDASILPPLPDRVIRGGAGILKLQAACGFRAFAEQRLAATTLDSVDAGMDARDRGSAVHLALEHFWKEVHSQAALQALSSTERHVILSRAIETALHRTEVLGTSDWDFAYMAVQHERLLSLLDCWLIAEMQRSVPFIVRQSETDLKDVRVGPLRLNLRVDRIDETEFGDVIVDYKTGAANPADWLTERPDEPQLPLYAVLSESTQLAGVAFGQVRAGKDMTLHGYQTRAGVLLKAARFTEAATLQDQVDTWRRVLTALAEDFHAGDVRVRPKTYPGTCEFCSQRLLCRLDLSLIAEEANGSETESKSEGDAERDRG